MKLSSLSVKRRSVKKSAFRTLFANVARKKHRAATAAAPMPELDGDVPNLGIARALVVILVIHVVAIAGIFAHSHWFEGDAAKAAAAPKELLEPAKPLPDSQAALQQIGEDDKPYMVGGGDSYATIAEAHGVTEEELRAANDNMELRAGRILRIPPRSIVALEPAELASLREGSAVIEAPVAAPAPVAAVVDEIRSAPMVETAAAATPVKVRPGVSRPLEEAPTAAAAAATPSKSYTVKNGDTFWKIAQANGTTPDAIMKANRITDPRKLRAGMQLAIP
jgi:LysM repeat protein